MSTYTKSFFTTFPNPLSPRIMKLIFATLLILVITVTVQGEPASNDVNDHCGPESSCADNVTKRGNRYNVVTKREAGNRYNVVTKREAGNRYNVITKREAEAGNRYNVVTKREAEAGNRYNSVTKRE